MSNSLFEKEFDSSLSSYSVYFQFLNERKNSPFPFLYRLATFQRLIPSHRRSFSLSFRRPVTHTNPQSIISRPEERAWPRSLPVGVAVLTAPCMHGAVMRVPLALTRHLIVNCRARKVVPAPPPAPGPPPSLPSHLQRAALELPAFAHS